MTRRVLVLLVVLVSALGASIASADVGTARRLYAEALRAYEARVPDFIRAERLFEQSFSEHPTPAALYGIARCQRARRHHADAIYSLTRFIELAGETPVEPTVDAVRAEIEELRRLVGAAELVIAPEGAAIEVDGEPRGEAPLTAPILLGPGDHQLRVSSEGYLTRVLSFDIHSGETSRVELTLEAVADQATLVLQSSPSDVGVWLDGTPLGETPLTQSIAPGTYQLRLWRDGFYTHEETISLTASQRLARNIGMTEDVVWNHWLFWTLVGAAVIGGGVALAYHFWPRTEIAGTIPPFIVESLAWP